MGQSRPRNVRRVYAQNEIQNATVSIRNSKASPTDKLISCSAVYLHCRQTTLKPRRASRVLSDGGILIHFCKHSAVSGWADCRQSRLNPGKLPTQSRHGGTSPLYPALPRPSPPAAAPVLSPPTCRHYKKRTRCFWVMRRVTWEQKPREIEMENDKRCFYVAFQVTQRGGVGWRGIKSCWFLSRYTG